MKRKSKIKSDPGFIEYHHGRVVAYIDANGILVVNPTRIEKTTKPVPDSMLVFDIDILEETKSPG